MTRLLASVRDMAEARLVADCGVPWIDLKEPAAGALGAVPLDVIAAAVAAFGATHTLSATIGDCWDTPQQIPARVAAIAATGAHYAKVGLFARRVSQPLRAALAASTSLGCGVIAVCFAEAPPREDDIQALAELGLAGLMLDTAEKSGPGLRALLSPAALSRFVAAVHGQGLLCGLAGRLAVADVPVLKTLGADYLGFRSALCADAERVAALDASSVQRLCDLFASPALSVAADTALTL